MLSHYYFKPCNDTLKLDREETLFLKFGKTSDINKRKTTYNSTTPNDVQILKTIYVKNNDILERCVAVRLDTRKMRKSRKSMIL